MPTKQNNVRLDEEIDARLDNLAKRTGRTKAFYITEAIEEFLDDHEDYYLAKDALDEFRQSNDAALDIDKMDLAEYDIA
ncbi:MAG TPA: ribbon-helix-helix protein, CopG family [Pseudolysinimonas sp.]|nr:ribbon-helix-helix protein, CopG family [Pseudolysinimonas sp.]